MQKQKQRPLNVGLGRSAFGISEGPPIRAASVGRCGAQRIAIWLKELHLIRVIRGISIYWNALVNMYMLFSLLVYSSRMPDRYPIMSYSPFCIRRDDKSKNS